MIKGYELTFNFDYILLCFSPQGSFMNTLGRIDHALLVWTLMQSMIMKKAGTIELRIIRRETISNAMKLG